LKASGIRARLAALNARAGDAPWRTVGGRLKKRFVFDDFTSAFAFMTRVAKVAEAMDHHPNWSNAYKTVDVALRTHSAEGLTPLDFRLASRMESLRGPRRRRPASRS
jgi:4a-hydroxytetrahydrobiopterin dehydratase